MLYIVIGLIGLVITFGGTKLVKRMDESVRNHFTAIEKNKGWPARITMFALRHPSIGFLMLVILIALWLWAVN